MLFLHSCLHHFDCGIALLDNLFHALCLYTQSVLAFWSYMTFRYVSLFVFLRVRHWLYGFFRLENIHVTILFLHSCLHHFDCGVALLYNLFHAPCLCTQSVLSLMSYMTFRYVSVLGFLHV